MNTTTPINTKTAQRRKLRFNSLDDVRNEINSLCANTDIRTTGNWTLAMAIDHLAGIMEGSLDGISAKAPLWLRLMSPLFRKKALHTGMDPGIPLTGKMRAILPPDDVTLDAARQRMNRVFARFDAGEKMTHRSPVFGKMTNEDWTNLHCRHAELHLSFMHPQ